VTKINPKVSVELTERELSYLYNKIGFPEARFPHLQAKLSQAATEMRVAKRLARRAAKEVEPIDTTQDCYKVCPSICWGCPAQ